MHFEYDLFHILNLVFSYYFIFNCVLHCGALLQQSRVPDKRYIAPFIIYQATWLNSILKHN